MDFSNLSVNGIALIPVIIGLVQFLKKFNLKGEILTGIAAGLGVAFAVLYQVAQLYPQVQLWLNIVVYGLAVGLSCSGLYDLSQTFKKSDVNG